MRGGGGIFPADGETLVVLLAARWWKGEALLGVGGCSIVTC
jgi:hypothetical protein